MLASYLPVGWCREEKCVSLLPACGLVSEEEMCKPRTCVLVGVMRKNVSLVPACGWLSGGEIC